MDQTDADQIETFVKQLTAHQQRVYGYVYSLLGDHSRSSDVVQETNLVLWRKIGEFEPDRPFLPWAFAIARFQVLAHLRDQKRDRCLLDSDLVSTLTEQVQEQAAHFDGFREALRHCVQHLSDDHRELVECRYFRALPIAEIAAATHRTAGAVKVALVRVRRQLADCVQLRLKEEG